MLGFKRRPASPEGDALAEAVARLEEAQARLADAPWDARRREEFRLAHNTMADLTSPGVPAPAA
jgi:hypothetical protein